MSFHYHILSNGIRVIHKEVNSEVGHCGVFINAGSRDEAEDESGMAHFIEHVIFKGTTKRKAYHVLNRLESVGGDLNAFTSKEETCVYASFLNEYYKRTLELFADIIFNSTFPEKEIEKEKDVVIDEIYSYKDSPSEEIFDEFEDLVYEGHPLGRNILGTKQEVKSFNRNKIIEFIKKHYYTSEMVIASVGNIPFKKLIGYIEKLFGGVASSMGSIVRNPYQDYKPRYKKVKRNSYLSHCMIGNTAFPRKDYRKNTLILLNNILGGPGLNSRLNLNIREKYGFTYNIESNYQAYSDTGVFNIYLGTDQEYLEKTINLAFKELKKLRDTKLGTLQLSNAKKQFYGQLAVSYENNLNEMLSIGKSYLLFEKVDTIKEIYNKIESINSEDIMECANIVFDPKMMSTLIYEAEEKQ
ncbi:MAG: M16 family metallopeptidase [Hyphomicrobiales bacterium]